MNDMETIEKITKIEGFELLSENDVKAIAELISQKLTEKEKKKLVKV
jgi:hypothetical protein